MKAKLKIINPTGLHARPAKFFVNLAKQFESNIQVRYGEKQVNAKSLISLLTLGVKPNDEIEIEITGTDEQKALDAFEQAVKSGLGEEDVIEKVNQANDRKPEEKNRAEHQNCYYGVAISNGIAIGKPFSFIKQHLTLQSAFRGLEKEQQEFEAAIEKVRSQISDMGSAMVGKLSLDEQAVLEAHLEILNDCELHSAVQNSLKTERSAIDAWQHVMNAWEQELSNAASEIIRSRVKDLQDIRRQVLAALSGIDIASNLPDEPVIVFAHELLPSDTIDFARKQVIGIALVEGRTTDHAAILARALGIPAVSGLPENLLELSCAEEVILHGEDGFLNTHPSGKELELAKKDLQQWKKKLEIAREKSAEAAQTIDGHSVEVAANIGNVEDARQAYENGADSVGLLRSEFLFTGRETAPDENEQAAVYGNIVQALQGKPLLLRTLDIGGDKPLPFIQFEPENNPFLGERGVRLTLREKSLMDTQIRAALQAAGDGPVRVMFPMIGDIDEWRAAKAVVDELSRNNGNRFLELGIMVEVPSAVILADVFAEEVDFFSIGTNDLTQYTMAMDRTHKQLGMKLDGLHPAVLRMIQLTVKAAHEKEKWVGVCGELAADPAAVPILVGLGVDELSVNVPAIPLVKAQIRELDYTKAQNLAQKALNCKTASEVRRLVE